MCRDIGIHIHTYTYMFMSWTNGLRHCVSVSRSCLGLRQSGNHGREHERRRTETTTAHGHGYLLTPKSPAGKAALKDTARLRGECPHFL